MNSSTPHDPRRSLWDRAGFALVAGTVFLSFFVYSAARSPVPGVGEPHYLAKATRYWQPEWCPGDFFLDSADTHRVFYQTVGSLTQWLTLEQTAWLGRGAGLLLLAVGWTALVARLSRRPWTPLWTAWLFLAMAAAGDWSVRLAWRHEGLLLLAGVFDLSGEWIVGGIEAKVFAWALLFWSLAFVADRRWNRAALCLGLSIAFHPVIGIWGLAAGAFAAAAVVVARGQRSEARGQRSEVRGQEAGGRSQEAGDRGQEAGGRRQESDGTAAQLDSTMNHSPLTPHPSPLTPHHSPRTTGHGPRATSLALLIAAALPGLLPALQVVGAASPQADAVLVFDRLKHHLDPMAFLPAAWVSFGLLLAVWLAGRRRVEFLPFERWFAWFVIGTVLIAAAGLLTGAGPRPYTEMPFWEFRAMLMKFYPFRLADVLVPLAAALVLVDLIEKRGLAPSRDVSSSRFSETAGASPLFSIRCWRTVVCWALFGSLFLFALLAPGFDRNPSRMSASRLADWKDACRWAAAETPHDALFLTSADSFAFKWYAGRAEYFAWKDIPQDAPGVLEWRRRKALIVDWSRRHRVKGRPYSAEAVRELAAETGITHVLTHDSSRFDLPLLYRNRSYAVYRIESEHPARVPARTTNVPKKRLWQNSTGRLKNGRARLLPSHISLKCQARQEPRPPGQHDFNRIPELRQSL